MSVLQYMLSHPSSTIPESPAQFLLMNNNDKKKNIPKVISESTLMFCECEWIAYNDIVLFWMLKGRVGLVKKKKCVMLVESLFPSR